MLKSKVVTGPAAYPTGGFTVRFGEFEKVNAAFVKELGGGEYLPQVAAISGNTVTIKVRNNLEQAVNEGGSATYTIGGEVAANTDLSGISFMIICNGY
jgi:hypothetical protein